MESEVPDLTIEALPLLLMGEVVAVLYKEVVGPVEVGLCKEEEYGRQNEKVEKRNCFFGT